jgi:DNA-binding CsgD family transcriptional regulator
MNAHTLVGRDDELARLRALLDAPQRGGAALLVVADAGAGKTALLEHLADHGRRSGTHVLSVAGRRSECDRPLAALARLLASAGPQPAGTPRPAGSPARGPRPPGTGHDRPAASTHLIQVSPALTALTSRGAVLVVVDDAQWVDRATLLTLALTAEHPHPHRFVVVAASRDPGPPLGLEPAWPELRIEPLPAPAARQFLELRSRPLKGHARTRVLEQAAGNPQALIEFARGAGADPTAGRRCATGPLPARGALSAAFTARVTGLPAATRHALLLAAVAESQDLDAAANGGYRACPESLAPAERAGLVRVGQAGVRFVHPLVRSAVHYAFPFAERALAHQELARALRDRPDRQAWHEAAAVSHVDEGAAARLESAAGAARRRAGAIAQARTLERAAELSPGPEDHARRLLRAAGAARQTGQGAWVAELAERALSLTDDPRLRIRARAAAGWSLAWTGRQSAAFTALLEVVEETRTAHPETAWDALSTAAAVAHQSGAAAHRRALRTALGSLREAPAPSYDTGPPAAWIGACAGSHTGGTDPETEWDTLLATTPEGTAAGFLGAAAWMRDETERAVGLLRLAVGRIREAPARGACAPTSNLLGWACVDAGRWDEALVSAHEARTLAEPAGMDLTAADADALTATVHALRGDVIAARVHARRTLRAIDPAESSLVTARALRALGWAASADTRQEAGFVHLSRLFRGDGSALHPGVSYHALGDLAASAVRAGRTGEGRAVVDRALAHLPGPVSPRLRQIVARARALTDPREAAAHFEQAMADRTGERWPFERAQLCLDHARSLRRQRRINDAKPLLAGALETFRGLGAAAWARGAEAELRACGVGTDTPANPAGIGELTAQQREIALLASRGLSNPQIAARLFLSPRTVASHLYRTYPKLGVSGRHQLRDLFGTAPGHGDLTSAH